jgi:hypothetical protein
MILPRNKKFLEVQKPFYKKVSGRRRQKKRQTVENSFESGIIILKKLTSKLMIRVKEKF